MISLILNYSVSVLSYGMIGTRTTVLNKLNKGTVTPTEARKTIFEDVLGFKQDDLAGVKIGFNGCRIIIFKLKQQFDVDELFEWQEFY